MKFPTSIFSDRFSSPATSPIFITIIAVLFLAVFVFNFIIQEKETKYIHDELHILASQREDTNKEMQTLSYKLNSALQEIKNIRTERVYLDEEMASVKRQINGIHLRLNNISERQDMFALLSTSLNEKRIKAVGIGLPLVPYEVNPRDEKDLSAGNVQAGLLKVEASLERQNITEHFQKAVFYQKNGELSKALQEYENILEKDPLNAEAHNNTGLLYQQKGEYNKALLAYRKAASLKPDYHKARGNIGTLLYRQGRLDTAVLVFEFILAKEPENVHALTNLAIIYKEKGELEKARDLLLKAVDFHNEFPEAHYNLALNLEELGSIDEAIIHYRAFLKYSHNTYTSLTTHVLNHLAVIEKK
ncbi:MAG: tetratricopeptide repeat protein [Candidatus Brocadiales bacterium]